MKLISNIIELVNLARRRISLDTQRRKRTFLKNKHNNKRKPGKSVFINIEHQISKREAIALLIIGDDRMNEYRFKELLNIGEIITHRGKDGRALWYDIRNIRDLKDKLVSGEVKLNIRR